MQGWGLLWLPLLQEQFLPIQSVAVTTLSALFKALLTVWNHLFEIFVFTIKVITKQLTFTKHIFCATVLLFIYIYIYIYIYIKTNLTFCINPMRCAQWLYLYHWWGISYSLNYLQCLQQCLVHRRLSVNSFRKNEPRYDFYRYSILC